MLIMCWIHVFSMATSARNAIGMHATPLMPVEHRER